jgi:hypothetical protein
LGDVGEEVEGDQGFLRRTRKAGKSLKRSILLNNKPKTQKTIRKKKKEKKRKRKQTKGTIWNSTEMKEQSSHC